MKYFIDRSFTIKRLRRVGSTDRSIISATATSVPGHLQNADPGKTQFNEGLIGKTFRVWIPLAELPISQIQPGDKLVQTGGPTLTDNQTYTVRSGKVVDFGSMQYIECEVTQQDEN